MHGVAARLEAAGIQATTQVLDGPEKGAILRAVDEGQAAMVGVAARPRGWLRQLFGESVADAVIGQGRVPVLVVPLRRPSRWARLRQAFAIRRRRG